MIAVTILKDEEYLALVQTPAGREAFALFCALIADAKERGNDGVFTAPHAVTAMQIGWPLDAFTSALSMLTKADPKKPWVSVKSGQITIRSFAKWNPPWGGLRGQDDGKMRQLARHVDGKVRPTETETETETETNSELNPSGDSAASRGSASASADSKRAHWLVRWRMAVTEFYGRDEKQRRSDMLAAEEWFERMWPPGTGDAIGSIRVQGALDIVNERATRSAKNRMAYLTKRMKSYMDGKE